MRIEAGRDGLGPTTPELDDEPVYFTPNQQRIIRAGECARAEQQRLEQLLGLQDGRTPDRKPDPGGISIKQRQGRSHLSPLRVRTPPVSYFFWEFFIQPTAPSGP